MVFVCLGHSILFLLGWRFDRKQWLTIVDPPWYIVKCSFVTFLTGTREEIQSKKPLPPPCWPQDFTGPKMLASADVVGCGDKVQDPHSAVVPKALPGLLAELQDPHSAVLCEDV